MKNLSALRAIPDSAVPDLDPAEVEVSPFDEAQAGALTLKGKVKKVIFRNEKSSFSVYAVKRKGGQECSLSAVSPVLLEEGEAFSATGKWEKYKGRDTFKADAVMLDIPKESAGIVAWLSSKLVEGVGKRTIEKLTEHFGDSLPDVVGKADELVKAGIGLQRAQTIADAWNTNALQAEMVAFLGRFNLGPSLISKVINAYGARTRQAIEENPWCLARDIDGIGFQTADDVAMSLNKGKDSVERILAGMGHVIAERVQRHGHCGVPQESLLNFATSLLRLPRAKVAAALPDFLKTGRHLLDPDIKLIYPNAQHAAETRLARNLASIAEAPNRGNLGRDEARRLIALAEKDLGVRLDEHQRQAATLTLTKGVCVITGGPGTGKSTTMRTVAHALTMADFQVVLCAPTGRAAKRLAEASGQEAKTAHRLLVWNPVEQRFFHGPSNPLKADWVIVDEYSMVDLWLADQFIAALGARACVTIVGDVDQLPSVGAGDVLRDIIESGVLPVARLNRIHRQGEGSGIVEAAHRINGGKMPLDPGVSSFNGFHLAYTPDPVETLYRVVDLVRFELPEQGYDPMSDIQVLTSMRRGDLGVEMLNQILKTGLNPALNDGRSVEVGERSFTIGDRVMHLRNDYTKMVFNGESGTVVGVNVDVDGEGKGNNAIQVDYGSRIVSYTKLDIADLEHSWATTVHKSQGSEFPVVVFVCADEHKNMLNLHLAYTAVTRAKGECWVVGSEAALQHAVATKSKNRRWTGLRKRLNPTLTLPHEVKPRPAPTKAQQPRTLVTNAFMPPSAA